VNNLLLRIAVLPVVIIAAGCATTPEPAVTVASEYPEYDEVKALYEKALGSEDCETIETVAVLLKSQSRSEALIPAAVVEEKRLNSRDLGAYSRHARRMVLQRKNELCHVPKYTVPAPKEADVGAIKEAYAMALESEDCNIIRGAMQRMVTEADSKYAPPTVELLMRIVRARPQCFGVVVEAE
jgi:hypothetical protein